MNAQIFQFPYSKVRLDLDKHEAKILKMPDRAVAITIFELAMQMHINYMLSTFFPK